jgi:hypothetical protein
MASLSPAAERRAQLVRGRAAELGLSLLELATRARLAPATVEAVLAATPGLSPTHATLAKLARGLDLPAGQLVAPGPADGVDASVDVEVVRPRQPGSTGTGTTGGTVTNDGSDTGISRTITVPVLSLSAT